MDPNINYLSPEFYLKPESKDGSYSEKEISNDSKKLSKKISLVKKEKLSPEVEEIVLKFKDGKLQKETVEKIKDFDKEKLESLLKEFAKIIDNNKLS